MPTVRELVADARARLAARGLPGREAGLLLARALGWDEGSILARDDFPVSTGPAARFAGWLERRLTGEPVAYLIGEREFYGRPFAVDSRVLIPRPETEHLIEAVLELPLPDDARVLDVGVGSGAIAATLALERPGWRVFASDLSLAALAVARANGRALGGRVGLAAGDLTAPWRLSAFDLVVSNPPYVAREGGETPADLRHEPALALFAPDHPAGPAVALYARLFAELGGAVGVRPDTPVVCEIGWNQEGAVAGLAKEAGFEARCTVRDYSGWPRTMVFLRR
jgi:release factor glutamine methyltransferase